MKVELKNNDAGRRKPYPKLMWKPARGSVWLMESDKIGTALYTPDDETYEIGEHCTCLDMGSLEDYEGSICLSND